MNITKNNMEYKQALDAVREYKKTCDMAYSDLIATLGSLSDIPEETF